jgi:hypothetical protein
MGKVCVGLLLIIGLSFSQPQVTIGLGKTKLSGEEFRYPANSGFIAFTFNSASRLQLGLQYEGTSAILNKRNFYSCSGIFFTTRLMFSPQTTRSPYLGFNCGWLNSSLSAEKILYQAHGSFCGEALAGYSFVIDEASRFNLEYQQRYLELKYADKQLQRSETMLASFSWLLLQMVRSIQPPQNLTPQAGAAGRRESLQQKLSENQEQLQKYEVLLRKYNMNSDESTAEKIRKERDELSQLKATLEKQNSEIREELKDL